MKLFQAVVVVGFSRVCALLAPVVVIITPPYPSRIAVVTAALRAGSVEVVYATDTIPLLQIKAFPED